MSLARLVSRKGSKSGGGDRLVDIGVKPRGGFVEVRRLFGDVWAGHYKHVATLFCADFGCGWFMTGVFGLVATVLLCVFFFYPPLCSHCFSGICRG